MRTTINIDDDVFAVIRSVAESTSRPIGKVASELIRKGLHREEESAYADGLPVFEAGESPSVITIDAVRKDEDGI